MQKLCLHGGSLSLHLLCTVLYEMQLQGLNWDGCYIGFQLRISRDPDVYNMKLWKHFFTLPSPGPAWHKFEMAGTAPLVSKSATSVSELFRSFQGIAVLVGILILIFLMWF